MNPIWPVALPTDLLRDLLNYLHETGSAATAEETVAEAVTHWLLLRRRMSGSGAARQAAAGAPGHSADGRNLAGYQWKWLFLPEGTRARITRRPDHGEAVVVGNHLMYKGMSVSPNQFACSATRGMRNAWRDLTLIFPGEKLWKRANVRRREYRQATLAAAGGPERRGQRMQRVTLADLRFDEPAG